jgi:hypothetical protein
LTHQFPQLEEAQNILAQQQPVVLTNPFPQGKNMAQASSSMNVPGGNQGAPMLNANNGATNVYMMRSDAHLRPGLMITECQNLLTREKKLPTHHLLFILRRLWEKL